MITLQQLTIYSYRGIKYFTMYLIDVQLIIYEIHITHTVFKGHIYGQSQRTFWTQGLFFPSQSKFKFTKLKHQ